MDRVNLSADGAGSAAPRNDLPFEQVRRIVGELDCSCRGALDDALDRFAAFQAARERRVIVRDGRRARAAIAAVAELLTDLDEVTGAESDSSAYGEFADLFGTIAAEAARGARLMRRLEAL